MGHVFEFKKQKKKSTALLSLAFYSVYFIRSLSSEFENFEEQLLPRTGFEARIVEIVDRSSNYAIAALIYS